MKLGLSSYTYVWSIGVPGFPAPARPMTAFDLLAEATEAGVEVVQIADNLPLERLTPEELDRLAADARRRGLTLELGMRGIAREHLGRFLALAQRLGAALVRVVIDTAAHKPTPDEVVSLLSAEAHRFERAGVWLALENHDRFKAATLRAIVESIGSDAVGVCLDTANSLGCSEGPDVVVEVLGPRVINLHLKDYAVTRLPHGKGFLVEGRPAGEGQLDILALLRRLAAFGRDPNAIVELWTPPEPTAAASIEKERVWAARSVRALRALMTEGARA